MRVDLNGLYGADTDLWSHAGHWFGRILNAVLLLLGIRFTKEEVSEAYEAGTHTDDPASPAVVAAKTALDDARAAHQSRT